MFILFFALLLDWLIGDPDGLWKRYPHPVVWIGRFLDYFDQKFNYGDEKRRKYFGIILVAILLFFSISIGVILHKLLIQLGWVGLFIEISIVSIFIAQKSLKNHVENIIIAHQQRGIEAARNELAKIVGRDTKTLNSSQISLAAIESLAENYSDGIVAPTMAYLFFGLPGIIAYKAINTADSMIGHKSEKYLHFGWCSARLDDWLNFIPARFTALLFALSELQKGAINRVKFILQKCKIEAPKHASPNAGWPECSMAYCLGIKLGGAREYQGKELKLASFNEDGKKHLTMDDIIAALDLFKRSSYILMALILALAIFL